VSGIYGTGYQNAFEQAQDQFNKEQAYGLDALSAQRTGGAEQRAIEQQGVSADLAQFEQERDYPKQNLLFMQSLLQGLPLETQTYSSYEPSGLQSLSGGLSSVNDIYQLLKTMSGSGGATKTGAVEYDEQGNPIP
jgi:hypothetical protein